MASKKSEAFRRAMKRAKPIFAGGTIEEQRKGMRLLGKVKSYPKGLVFDTDSHAPLDSAWVRLENQKNNDYALIYMHGGAYCTGDLSYSKGLAATAASVTGINTFYFDYRLAPEHPFPAAVEDALAAYFYVLDLGIKPAHVGFIGDSAGGGLIVATALALRQKGNPMPGAIACISPWVDLANAGEYEVVDESEDPILVSENLIRCASYYSGEEPPENPLISPVYADYRPGFPPTLIHAGTKEILLKDALRLKEKMDSQGVDVRMDVYEGMWHVWHLFDMPESHDAMVEIQRFFYEKLHIREGDMLACSDS